MVPPHRGACRSGDDAWSRWWVAPLVVADHADERLPVREPAV